MFITFSRFTWIADTFRNRQCLPPQHSVNLPKKKRVTPSKMDQKPWRGGLKWCAVLRRESGGSQVLGGSWGVWGGVPEGKTLPEGGLGGSGTRISVGGGEKWSKTRLWDLKMCFIRFPTFSQHKIKSHLRLNSRKQSYRGLITKMCLKGMYKN